jgi:hypothetical protein
VEAFGRARSGSLWPGAERKWEGEGEQAGLGADERRFSLTNTVLNEQRSV